MSAQSIVCGACNAEVPYGRLSCPECGELLASVAGSRRVVMGAVTNGASAAQLGAGRTNGSSHAPSAPTRTRVLAPRRPEPAVLLPVAGIPALATTTASEPVASLGTPFTTVAPAPGAYVPRPPTTTMPSGPAAPARAWAGRAVSAAAPADARTGVAASASTPTHLAEFVRWLAVAGSTLSAVGFLLPLANTVIGASGVGFLDRWGLAGPFHLVVVLGLLAILGLALFADRVPLWIRVGLPGLGLGALLIGLVWPYHLVGVLRAGPGAVAILVGAILLGVAGVVALVSDRHGSHDRAV